jgi:hypothetical protein
VCSSVVDPLPSAVALGFTSRTLASARPRTASRSRTSADGPKIVRIGIAGEQQTWEGMDDGTTDALEGAWITKIAGKLFFNFSGKSFELLFEPLFELPQGTSLSMGTFAVDATKTPAQIDLTLTDGIGKNGDRLRGRASADVVRGIVQRMDDTLKFFAPPPELEGRPTAFPEAAPGLIGQNLYLVLKRAA